MFWRFSPARRRVLAAMSAICVFCWIVAGMEITSARYRTKKEDRVSVRVATFLVETGDLRLESPDTVLDCNLEGDRVSFSFVVRNRSEVAVTYEVSAVSLPPSLRMEAEAATGELAPNGAETTVRVHFYPADPADRSQATALGNIILQVSAAQKGGDHE